MKIHSHTCAHQPPKIGLTPNVRTCARLASWLVSELAGKVDTDFITAASTNSLANWLRVAIQIGFV